MYRAPDNNTDRVVHIGELAADVGINPKTIRYYEEIGLLPEPSRSPSGYRLYTTADRERLRFILKAKATGLTLDEIGEVVALRRDGGQPCAHVLTLIDRKLAAVDDQIRALLALRRELVSLRDEASNAADDARSDARFCPIIEHHDFDRGDNLSSPRLG